MGIQTGLIIAIFLGLLGVFFSIRAGVHSLQLSRRQSSWPERRKQMDAGWRYFGLAFILMVGMVAGFVMIGNGDFTRPLLLSSPSPTPVRTATKLPSKTWTNTPALTSTPVPTETPTPTSTPVLTLPWAPLPSQTPLPTDTPWPTWTPSLTPSITPTPTVTLTPTVTRTPTATSTPLPTQTPLPTDTRWPVLTPTGSK